MFIQCWFFILLLRLRRIMIRHIFFSFEYTEIYRQHAINSMWRRISSAKYVQDVFVHRFYAENFNLFWGFITSLRICRRTWHPSGNMVYDITNIRDRVKAANQATVCNKNFPRKIKQDLSYEMIVVQHSARSLSFISLLYIK